MCVYIKVSWKERCGSNSTESDNNYSFRKRFVTKLRNVLQNCKEAVKQVLYFPSAAEEKCRICINIGKNLVFLHIILQKIRFTSLRGPVIGGLKVRHSLITVCF